nr:hypothetical protein [uncultured Psychroserpens sp.]
MARNYTNLIENIKHRTNPDAINESEIMDKTFSAELRDLADKKVLEYIKRAMRGVESRYAERTIEAGNKVMMHLKNNNSSLDYKFQGSVPSNTHIVGHSDIDLVQITNSFYSHESKSSFTNKFNSGYLTVSEKSRLLDVINGSTYFGDVNADLRKLRTDAELVLTSVYKNVDITKAKSIEVNPTNPDRIVDVVTASWYVNVDSVLTNDETDKGIQIYNKEKNTRLPVDFPFMKIKLLNEKDKSVNGRLKKMIRFLKNLKADSDYTLKEISSFDISSICYNIPIYNYENKPYYELVVVLFSEFMKIFEDENYRNSIMSIDGSEPIFRGKDEKVDKLRLLFRELFTVNEDLMSQTSYAKFL